MRVKFKYDKLTNYEMGEISAENFNSYINSIKEKPKMKVVYKEIEDKIANHYRDRWEEMIYKDLISILTNYSIKTNNDNKRKYMNINNNGNIEGGMNIEQEIKDIKNQLLALSLIISKLDTTKPVEENAVNTANMIINKEVNKYITQKKIEYVDAKRKRLERELSWEEEELKNSLEFDEKNYTKVNLI